VTWPACPNAGDIRIAKYPDGWVSVRECAATYGLKTADECEHCPRAEKTKGDENDGD
jgi:hypothetical protein